MGRIKHIALFIAYTLFLTGMVWLINYRDLDPHGQVSALVAGAWILALVFYVPLIIKGDKDDR